MTDEAAILMTTVAGEDQADALAGMLLERRLAACVQALAITSRYRWQGKVQRDPEVLLLVKTSAGRADAAVAAIEAEHPYDTPEILTVPVSGGSAAYLRWLIDETGDV